MIMAVAPATATGKPRAAETAMALRILTPRHNRKGVANAPPPMPGRVEKKPAARPNPARPAGRGRQTVARAGFEVERDLHGQEDFKDPEAEPQGGARQEIGQQRGMTGHRMAPFYNARGPRKGP